MVIGTPVLLDNLFSSYNNDLISITGWLNEARVDKRFTPPCKTICLKMPNAFLQRIFDRYCVYLIPVIKYFIIYNLRKSNSKAGIGIFHPGAEFLIAGYQACEYLKIPFITYVHDLWIENLSNGSKKWFLAKKWEKDFYQKKYGISSGILPHTIKDIHLNKIIPKSLQNENFDRNKTIVYSGNISHEMNLDILQEFVRSVEFLPDSFEVKMYISWDKKICIKNNIFSEKIEYGWLTKQKLKQEIKNADLLLLPLSLKNCSEHEVNTVFSTKTLDYLVSETPIFCIAPKASHHYKIAKSNGWAKVIDDDNPQVIARTMINTVKNKKMCESYVQNAFKEANNRRSSIYSKKLMKLVDNL